METLHPDILLNISPFHEEEDWTTLEESNGTKPKTKSSPQAKKSLVLNSPRNEGIAKCVSRKCPSKNVLDMTNVGPFGIC